MTTSQLWCQTRWHKVIRCKGESPESWLKWIVSLNDRKLLRIRLLKACRPVCTENTQSTWVYGIAYVFRIIKGPKLNNLFQYREVYCSCWIYRQLTVTMKLLYALICDEIWKEVKRMKLKVKDEIKGENVGLISTSWPNGQLGLWLALWSGAPSPR